MKIDPIGRAAALQLAAGRLAVGAGTLFATGPALRAFGFGETDAAGRALARMLGARDLAIGGLTLASRGNREALRTATLAAAALDAADVLAFSLAARDAEIRQAGLIGAASAGFAAAAGFWAARRLG